jgi:hypothetical protein
MDRQRSTRRRRFPWGAYGPGEALACAVTSGVDLALKLKDTERVGHHEKLDEDGRRALRSDDILEVMICGRIVGMPASL